MRQGVQNFKLCIILIYPFLQVDKKMRLSVSNMQSSMKMWMSLMISNSNFLIFKGSSCYIMSTLSSYYLATSIQIEYIWIRNPSYHIDLYFVLPIILLKRVNCTVFFVEL